MPFYTPDTFYPDFSIGYLLKSIHVRSHAKLDAMFVEEGITATQWSALISIYFGRSLTCAALARDLAHDKGAMTRMIDAMEERGLLTRERDVGDRRLINLALTPDGHDVAHRCRLKLMECWNEWLSDWDRDEITTLIAQLQKLRRTIEASDGCAS
jgi:DNA-binding MarR family transcriptional regulator